MIVWWGEDLRFLYNDYLRINHGTSLELSTCRGPDGTPVVTAVGEIDMSNADKFRDA